MRYVARSRIPASFRALAAENCCFALHEVRVMNSMLCRDASIPQRRSYDPVIHILVQKFEIFFLSAKKR